MVKNVTGYDLSKLMTGSFGTLAILGELTLRTIPRPEHEATVVLRIARPGDATECFSNVLGSTYEVTAAAWIPNKLSERVGLEGDVALLRFEGFQTSVAERCKRFVKDAPFEHSLIDGTRSATLWRDLSNAKPFLSLGDEWSIWRLSLPPSNCAQVIEKLPGACTWIDWAGGMIWFAIPNVQLSPTVADAIRETLSNCGGHATLIRSPPSIREKIPVFHPRPSPHAALYQRIKQAFDPWMILNPGRMHA